MLPYSLSHVWAPQVRACLKKALDSIVGSTLLLQSESLWLAINHAAALVRSRIIGDKRIPLAQWKAARQIDLSAKDEVKQWKMQRWWAQIQAYQFAEYTPPPRERQHDSEACRIRYPRQ